MHCTGSYPPTHACTVLAPAPHRYIFCSILHCDKHPEVPLMNIKHCTEQFLASSGLNYTTFRLCGFMQVRARACVRACVQACVRMTVVQAVAGPGRRGVSCLCSGVQEAAVASLPSAGMPPGAL